VTERVTRQGLVVKKLVARGSKSEHEAVVMQGDHGELILRRMGGHPFSDPSLDELVGKTLKAEGFEAGPSLIMTDWSEI
jgi:hypothetical protein